MKKLIFILIFHLVLLGCAKEEEFPSNFIEGKFVSINEYYQIVVRDLNWTNTREFSVGQAWGLPPYSMPLWSSDGSQILYVTKDYGQLNSIMIMDSNGDNKRQVLQQPGGIFATDWSSDDQLIAYNANGPGGGFHIMSLDGQEHKILNENGDYGVTAICLSHDTKKIAVYSDYTNNGELLIIDIASEEVVYSKTEVLGMYSRPYWSPDDKYIVYNTQTGEERLGKIVLLNVEDESETIIKEGEGQPVLYRIFGWTPDGHYIIFVSTPDFAFKAINITTNKEVELNYKSKGALDYPKGDLFIFE